MAQTSAECCAVRKGFADMPWIVVCDESRLARATGRKKAGGWFVCWRATRAAARAVVREIKALRRPIGDFYGTED